MTRITIISGFLGAGKTTLIKKLLAEAFPGEKLVLIENEFGEISIDGGFLKDSGVEISEMSSGCICCSLVGDFREALTKVYEQFKPDRILIEPSGVGKLSDVVKAVESTVEHCPEMQLHSAVTVADGSKVKIYMKNFGEFYNDQIEHADAIILSRTQKLTAEKLSAALEMLRGKNPHAAVVTTPWDELDGKAILRAMEKHDLAHELLCEHEHHHDHDHEHHHHHEHDEHCTCGCHDHDHHHHHADEVFSSWGRETPKAFSRSAIENILAALDSGEYGAVLRAKGIVQGEEGWLEFDYVPEEYEVRACHADYTGRLCVIGAQLKEDKLAELFGV